MIASAISYALANEFIEIVWSIFEIKRFLKNSTLIVYKYG